jgi:hypothetical protein
LRFVIATIRSTKAANSLAAFSRPDFYRYGVVYQLIELLALIGLVPVALRLQNRFVAKNGSAFWRTSIEHRRIRFLDFKTFRTPAAESVP